VPESHESREHGLPGGRRDGGLGDGGRGNGGLGKGGWGDGGLGGGGGDVRGWRIAPVSHMRSDAAGL
jgi:hypothetical protein